MEERKNGVRRKSAVGRVICFVSAAVVIMVFAGAFIFFDAKGISPEEKTNSIRGKTPVNRTDETPVSSEEISFGNEAVSFMLPDNFYFANEYEDEDRSVMKSYFNFDYSVMADISLLKEYMGYSVVLDSEKGIIALDNRNTPITSEKWLEELQLTYLENTDPNNIKTADVNGNTVRYFIGYEETEEKMMGILIGVIDMGDGYYYGVKIVEHGKDKAPEFPSYSEVFDISFEQEK